MPENDRKTASVGDWIKVKEQGFDEVEVYHLARITNPKKNMVAQDNPMGKALVGVRPGDEVTVHGPSGPIKFSVLDVGRDEIP